MFRKSILVLPLTLAACFPNYQPLSIAFRDDPDLVSSISKSDLCRHIFFSESNANWSEADKMTAYRELRNQGFSRRDSDLISKQGVQWGTGMTFKGLKCSGGEYELSINKSFYPHIGHQWQVDMGNFNFVYLKGDGTEPGMRVYAWN